MIHYDTLSPNAYSTPWPRIFLTSSLFCCVVLGCGPKSDFGTTNTTTESTSIAATTATSSPSVTDTGALTVGVATSSSSNTTVDPTSTTADPTCPVFICGDVTVAECDLFAQDCPDGEKCAAVMDPCCSYNSARCVPVGGTDVAGEPCTAKSVPDGLDSCAKGNMCWGVQEGNGICIGLCMGTEDKPTCPHMGSCVVSPYLNFCTADCDPLLQTCDPFAGCYAAPNGFLCVTDASGDKGKANDPCEFFNACNVGLLCVQPALAGAGCPPDAMGCCTPFCEFPGGACPNPDQQCVQWFDPAELPEGDPQVAIGFCGVPQ